MIPEEQVYVIESLLNDILKSTNIKNHTVYKALMEKRDFVNHEAGAPDKETDKY